MWNIFLNIYMHVFEYIYIYIYIYVNTINIDSFKITFILDVINRD